jgi:hypothetical protein
MDAALGPTVHWHLQDFSFLHRQCGHIVVSGDVYHHHHNVLLVSWHNFGRINMDATLGDNSRRYRTDPSDLQCALRQHSMSIAPGNIPHRDTHGSPALEGEWSQTGMADVLGYVPKDYLCGAFSLEFALATSTLLSVLGNFTIHTFILLLANAHGFAWLFY